jgi:hypothetical protein
VNTLKNPIDVETFIKERKLPNWTPDYKGKKIVDIPKTMESVQKYLQSIGDLAEVLRNEVTSTVGAEKDASDTDATAAKAEEDSDSKKQPVPGCQQNCCCQNGNAGAAEATAKPATSSRKDPPDHGGSITGVPFRAGDFPLLLVVHSDPSSLASDPDYAACVPPAAASPDPDANPCVQFVSLTSSAATSGGASGGGGGGGSGHGGGQGGGGNNQGGNNQGGGNQGGGNQGGGNAAVSPSQPVDCSRQSSASGPCAFSRVFTVDEAEWWDVSLGLATPGPKEATYTFSTSSMAPKATPGCPLGYTCGFKHHADAYILFDFYPFAKTWGHGSHAFAAHDSPAPHVNFGIPITSQSLYRPYWGVAENLTWYAERHWKFPLSVSFYSGLTWMKQSLCESSCVASTTAIQPIPQDRALKGTYGFEVSISAIAGKLKGGGSSKSGGSGGSSKTGGN